MTCSEPGAEPPVHTPSGTGDGRPSDAASAPTDLAPATLCAQAGHARDAATGAVVPPVHMATTYARDADYALIGPEYTRDQNPGYDAAERVIAGLEGGAEAALFGSGQAAGQAVAAALVPPGGRMVVPALGYHALLRQFARLGRRYGFAVDRYDARDPDALARTIAAGPADLVWVETPSNPLWQVVDIARAAELAHAAGAVLAVDNTAMTPLLQRPLALGADLVMHSATKALNGHSDAMAGVLVTARADEIWARVRAERAQAGAVPGPFEAWLLLRGLRTLALRVGQASANALALAEALVDHPGVEAVLYPGLADHPGHAVHRAQTDTGRGHGSLLSILVHGGAARARRVASATRLFIPATSIGGVESLIEHRHTIEGPDSPTPESLLRLSVGIEDAGDLIADLVQALDRTAP
ncbi:hypothetical protein CCR85_10570 [Rhodothalassium salexigens]|uniref:trans-sulfuration enzyme family protein n=1 Tax=Rhodothalassium salexigens TaxID=1086 RepID=UPI001913C4C1|nr:aminotransferase class V-fold PLP-dependent enzyme [Rhodothalassium salexigens]MBK5911932.1 hypothetical protein [Rhodothalassium salexigens]MBK5921119.1 hypothetical protein [Rhodothalassium salexigens]